jgi:hypothetical protein
VRQAADEAAHHGDTGAADAREQGGYLEGPDTEALLEGQRKNRPRAAPRLARFTVEPAGGHRNLGGPAEALANEQDNAVQGEEDRRGQGLGEDGPEGVLQGNAGEAYRDRGDDDQPGQTAVIVLGDDPSRGERRPEAAKEPTDDASPLLAEEQQQRGGRRHVQSDNEGQVERRAAVCGGGLGHQRLPGATDDRGQQDRVAEAGHGEQLGDALCQSYDHGLQVAKHG